MNDARSSGYWEMDASSTSQSESFNVRNIYVRQLLWTQSGYFVYCLRWHRCTIITYCQHRILIQLSYPIWVCIMNRVLWFVRQLARLWSRRAACYNFQQLQKDLYSQLRWKTHTTPEKKILSQGGFWMHNKMQSLGFTTWKREDAQMLNLGSEACRHFHLSKYEQRWYVALSRPSCIVAACTRSRVYPHARRAARFYCQHL